VLASLKSIPHLRQKKRVWMFYSMLITDERLDTTARILVELSIILRNFAKVPMRSKIERPLEMPVLFSIGP